MNSVKMCVRSIKAIKISFFRKVFLNSGTYTKNIITLVYDMENSFLEIK